MCYRRMGSWVPFLQGISINKMGDIGGLRPTVTSHQHGLMPCTDAGYRIQLISSRSLPQDRGLPYRVITVVCLPPNFRFLTNLFLFLQPCRRKDSASNIKSVKFFEINPEPVLTNYNNYGVINRPGVAGAIL